MTLNEINSKNKLASTLRCQVGIIETILQNGYKVITDLSQITAEEYRSNVTLVRTYTIEKKGKKGGKRTIYVPVSQTLSNLLKILSRELSKIYVPEDCVHGFVKKRGIFSNANSHLEQKYLLQLDLKNFFEQINDCRLQRCLTEIGIDEGVSQIISKISTVNGILVQGFNTSPILSNIVAIQLDRLLIDYANKNNIIYTRYADDMSLSSNEKYPDDNVLKAIVESQVFSLNTHKTKKSIRGHFQSVTGLTIYDGKRARIPKKIKKNLRLEVYYISKFGLKNHVIRELVRSENYNKNINKEEVLSSKIFETRNRIMGWIRFIKGIEPEFSTYLEEMFRSRHNENSL